MGLGSLSVLTRLVLAENELQNLPVYFGGMVKLGYLDASSNQLTSVPSELFEKTQLSELMLTGNPMDRLALQQIQGFELFTERRKQRIDAKIDCQVVGAIN